MGSQTEPLGVAVVGLGFGEQHVKEYVNLSNCYLHLLYDLDIEKAELAAKKWGGIVVESFENIIDDPRVKIISIVSYDDAHYEQVIKGLSARKHLFVEKPLCNTLDELKAIKAAWYNHKGQVKLSSNLVLRAAPLYIWLKEKISAGEFGEIYAFDGDYLYGRLWKITHGWRGKAKNYSGMKGGGVHLIDLMIWLTGERPSSVYILGNKICTRNMNLKHCDFMASTLRFESGLVGRITANLGCVHRHHHVIRIFGTKATFIYDDVGPRVHSTCDPHSKATSLSLAGLPKSESSLIIPFVEAIIEDKNIDAHTQEIFDVISIATACDRALKSNSEVDIEYA